MALHATPTSRADSACGALAALDAAGLMARGQAAAAAPAAHPEGKWRGPCGTRLHPDQALVRPSRPGEIVLGPSPGLVSQGRPAERGRRPARDGPERLGCGRVSLGDGELQRRAAVAVPQADEGAGGGEGEEEGHYSCGQQRGRCHKLREGTSSRRLCQS